MKRCAYLISQEEIKETGAPKAVGQPRGSGNKAHWKKLKKQQREAERVAAENKIKEQEEAEARKSSLRSRRHDTSPTPKSHDTTSSPPNKKEVSSATASKNVTPPSETDLDPTP